MMRGAVYELRAPKRPAGHEVRKERFCIVVSSEVGLRLSTWLVVPTSASAGEALYRPQVVIDGTTTHALPEQLSCVDPEARLGRLVGHLTFAEMEAVERGLRRVLGL